jgi:hypothetical protein
MMRPTALSDAVIEQGGRGWRGRDPLERVGGWRLEQLARLRVAQRRRAALIAGDGVVLAHIIEQGGERREHAKVSRNKPQKAGIGGFRAESYAKDPFLRVLTVYFCKPAAATQTAQCAEHRF